VLSLWLERAAGLLPINDQQAASEKIRALGKKLSLITPEQKALEILGGLAPMTALEPGVLFERTLSLMEKLARQLITLGPLILAVDNTRFLDRVSYRLLHALMTKLERLPVLLLFACDDEALRDAFAPLRTRAIRLAEL